MPNTDPSLTHTVTTREAGEGVAVAESVVVNSLVRGFLKAVVEQPSVISEIASLKSEIASLRSRLARAEAIEKERDRFAAEADARRTWNERVEAAAKDVFALRYLACLTLDTAIYKLWLATKGTPSLYPAVVVPTAPAAIPTPAEAEAEVERLRGEVEELRASSEYANKQAWEQMSEGTRLRKAIADQGKKIVALESENKQLKADADRSIEINNGLERENAQLAKWLADSKEEVERLRGIEATLTKRWQARNADLRAKLDALVGAVDKMGHNPSVIATDVAPGWTGVVQSKFDRLRLAADAARQPTEAR